MKMKVLVDDPPPSFCGMVGKSTVMKDLFRQISILAGKEVKVLIQGERGTGKELVAKAIKALSSRKDKTYKTVNCGGLSRDLIASELWGHEKGAFTGAVDKKIGLVPSCHGGTLFLDEIGNLCLDAQAMFLRFLQEDEVHPIGALEDIHVDVRIIAATNKDLIKQMSEGKFREDLYDRLNEITLYLPPLQDRADDIELLTCYFIQIFNQKHKMKVEGITKEGMDLIRQYDWPGNVRELEKAINRAVVYSGGKKLIRAQDLRFGENEKSNFPINTGKGGVPPDKILKDGITPRQKEIIRIARNNGGKVKNKELIQSLGVSREIIRRDLNNLCSLGFLEQRGQKKGSFFVLKTSHS